MGMMGTLLKHFCVVGRQPEGDTHLEKSQLGTWRHVTSLRPELILSFPRAAGSVVRRAWVEDERLDPIGRSRTPKVGGGHLPILKGSLVYSPAPVAGEIDDHFGWNQKERNKTSRLHYHGRNERQKRSRVTMMI